jgi:hypothetical protein
MLGNLQADMSRQGVNTTQKGCCNACEKPIVGQVKPPQASTKDAKTLLETRTLSAKIFNRLELF